MSEEMLEILAEEALGSLHGLPPGMISAARLAGIALSAGESSSKPDSRFQYQTATGHLDEEEERIANSLLAIASRTIANEYGTDFSRVRREEAAQGIVKMIADAPGSISSQDATETMFTGTHRERMDLIRRLSTE